MQKQQDCGCSPDSIHISGIIEDEMLTDIQDNALKIVIISVN